MVAVILSAQATDISVNKATKPLFEKVTTPEQMLLLGEDNLKLYIKSIGLFNSKAKNIIEMSKQLIMQFDSKVPESLTDLISLAGVGSKTARVILNSWFKHPIIAVDTHVFRVSKRLGIATKDSVTKVEEELNQKIPTQWKLNAHNWLVLHGRYICTARNPKCHTCPLSALCHYKSTL